MSVKLSDFFYESKDIFSDDLSQEVSGERFARLMAAGGVDESWLESSYGEAFPAYDLQMAESSRNKVETTPPTVAGAQEIIDQHESADGETFRTLDQEKAVSSPGSDTIPAVVAEAQRIVDETSPSIADAQRWVAEAQGLPAAQSELEKV